MEIFFPEKWKTYSEFEPAVGFSATSPSHKFKNTFFLIKGSNNFEKEKKNFT